MKTLFCSLLVVGGSLVLGACDGDPNDGPDIGGASGVQYWEEDGVENDYLISFDASGLTVYEMFPQTDCFVQTRYYDLTDPDKFSVTTVENGMDVVSVEDGEAEIFRIEGSVLTISDETGEAQSTFHEVSEDALCDDSIEGANITFSLTFDYLPEQIEKGVFNLEAYFDINGDGVDSTNDIMVRVSLPEGIAMHNVPETFSLQDYTAIAYLNSSEGGSEADEGGAADQDAEGSSSDGRHTEIESITYYRSVTSEIPISVEGNTLTVTLNSGEYAVLAAISQSTPVHYQATYYGSGQSVTIDGTTYASGYGIVSDFLPERGVYQVFGDSEVVTDEQGDYRVTGGVVPFNIDIESATLTVK